MALDKVRDNAAMSIINRGIRVVYFYVRSEGGSKRLQTGQIGIALKPFDQVVASF